MVINKWKVFETMGWLIAYCLISLYYQVRWLPLTLPIAIIFKMIPVIFMAMGLCVGLALTTALIGAAFRFTGYLDD